MVAYGGTSKNTNASARGRSATQKCKNCGRSYVMEWAKDSHERLCYQKYS